MKGIREFLRKTMVSLKRKPQTIALVVLGVAFIYYSLNLTHVSDTTAKIQRGGMGLCGFTTMLLSVLSMVCFLNAFPHRKKVNAPMLVLMFLMVGVIIFCDGFYLMRVEEAIHNPDNPMSITGATAYIGTVRMVLKVHMGILACSALLTALLPAYTPLLRKVRTSVEVEYNASMNEIDITSED